MVPETWRLRGGQLFNFQLLARINASSLCLRKSPAADRDCSINRYFMNSCERLNRRSMNESGNVRFTPESRHYLTELEWSAPIGNGCANERLGHKVRRFAQSSPYQRRIIAAR
jgi:hypothetical protein